MLTRDKHAQTSRATCTFCVANAVIYGSQISHFTIFLEVMLCIFSPNMMHVDK
jgi:hypothetical protein